MSAVHTYWCGSYAMQQKLVGALKGICSVAFAIRGLCTRIKCCEEICTPLFVSEIVIGRENNGMAQESRAHLAGWTSHHSRIMRSLTHLARTTLDLYPTGSVFGLGSRNDHVGQVDIRCCGNNYQFLPGRSQHRLDLILGIVRAGFSPNISEIYSPQPLSTRQTPEGNTLLT